jgi:hypothetical protein
VCGGGRTRRGDISRFAAPGRDFVALLVSGWAGGKERERERARERRKGSVPVGPGARESDRVGPVPVKAAVRRAKEMLAGAVFGKGRQASPGSSSLHLGFVPKLLLALATSFCPQTDSDDAEEKPR